MTRAPFLTIMTPAWNREDYLHRLWRSLAKQTNKNFEWVIADDGSTDNTATLVRELGRISDFPVLFLEAEKQVGKVRLDNQAIKLASGELFAWCGSDDRLVEDAVQTLWENWSAIPEVERDSYVGLTALAATEEGVIYDPFSTEIPTDITWNDLTEKYKIRGDMFYAIRTSALKSHPFPEVDLVIPESVVFSQIGDRPTRYIPKVIYLVEYETANAISFSGRMNYNRGRAKALAISRQMTARYPRSRRQRWRELVTYLRWSQHGEVPFFEASSLWGHTDSMWRMLIALPPAFGLAAIDRLCGKVDRSHREFDANRDAAVTATWLKGKPASQAGEF